jgi:Icc-related predicted phosphoesterase
MSRGALRVLHSSDLHGACETLLAVQEDFEVWLDTGDFFPNLGRVEATGFRIDPIEERRHQLDWFTQSGLGPRLRDWLQGRKALSVPGNHDFVSLTTLLRQSDVDADEITIDGVCVSGVTWAGFREVPWMRGEWEGEVRHLASFVDAAFAADPDMLATHAPPAGILDRPGFFGIPELATALTGRKHNIKAHFFGHEHDDGGKWVQVGETLCVNAAAAVVVVTVAVPERVMP